MKAALALVLALPFGAAHAGLIGVDYEGTVTEVGEGPISGGGRTFDYAVGDRIAGRLFVDPSLARPSATGLPGEYSSSDTGFVTGIFADTGVPQEEFDPESGDAVGLGHNVFIEGIAGPVDHFLVQDGFIRVNTRVNFSIEALVHEEFLHGTDLNPSFELTSADVNEPNEFLSGAIADVSAGFNTIRFALSRLTVKPGQCFSH